MTNMYSRRNALHAVFLLSCFTAAVARKGNLKSEIEEVSSKDCDLNAAPPKADRRPKQLVTHGDVRKDFYFWLQDDERKDPDVLNYLKAENEYTETGIDQNSVDLLYKEMRSRIQEDDRGTPRRRKNYFYYSNKLKGQEHGGQYRRRIPDDMGPPSIYDEMDESIAEEVVLDKEKEAKKHEFYSSPHRCISVDEKLVAYAEDTSGAERFDIYIKDIATGKQFLSEPIANATGTCAWSADGTSLFYATRDAQNRPSKLWRHDLNSGKEDTLVYDETNPGVWIISVFLSRDEEVIVLFESAGDASEYKFLDSKNPKGEFETILEAQPDVRYIPLHRGDHFYMAIMAAEKSQYKFVVAPKSDPTQQKVLISSEEGVNFISFSLSKNFLATLVLKKGVYEITIYSLPEGSKPPKKLGKGMKIDFDEPAYKLSLGAGGDFDSDILRIHYTSQTTPETKIDIDMRTGKRATKKIDPILGDFDQTKYKTERIFATAEDGVEIPMSMVYRNDKFNRDGSNDLMVAVYGAHEVVLDPTFSSKRLTLLDRGFVYVLAHVRGGGFFGREWFDAGRNLKKKTTFTDAISCVEHLIDQKYTSAGKVSISGSSSGGLAVGAIVNMRPDLFVSATLVVPLVDLLTMFLDGSIPTVRVNWPEFGNPNEEEVYEYMKSYSPVDNVRKADYPHMYVTAGLADPRVGYWGPAKFVAKLRHLKTDANKLFLETDLSAGHSRNPGRFVRLKDDAKVFAFVLKAHGKLGGFCS
ncbi:hypothetical protein BSKO_04255 [Bryopsis sp. KO-2023]|nr:hypothetical protein BSKO_04255 [Bryopsis sp. KO-2023]